MIEAPRYPKRLIEVDLPIKRISAHARREKSIRHGHISTLHIWWARRPLAACRAIICAALWPDPADALCPESFRDTARCEMRVWATIHLGLLSEESYTHFNTFAKSPQELDDPVEIRKALLDFIAEFSNWDNSTVKEYLDTSRLLTHAAHESMGGTAGTRPLVMDPFAGGGAIPLEALRVGADTFASDLNPVPVLLNKVVLEHIPKYGQRLCDEVRKWGAWIKREAAAELASFYPVDSDGSAPVAYLWARTIRCEGPGCGAQVPLIRSPWLKKDGRAVALSIRPDRRNKTVEIEIVENAQPADVGEGTVKRSSATCPCCGYTTSAERVRSQFADRRGGAADARLLAIVSSNVNRVGRSYRTPSRADTDAADAAARRLTEVVTMCHDGCSPLPTEPLPYLRSIFNINLLGVNQWQHLFTPRQLLALTTLILHLRRAEERVRAEAEREFADALITTLALAIDRQADYGSSLCRWVPTGEFIGNTFGRQALGIIWDFAETNPFGNGSGNFDGAVSWVAGVCDHVTHSDIAGGHVEQASATSHPLPDDSVAAFVTDPPYYDSVPYADLSDFFYVWLKRSIGGIHPSILGSDLSPKELEVVQLAERNRNYSYKTKENFEALMVQSLAHGRRATVPGGIGVVVFAHKATAAWETMLQAVTDAGWVITASWPIDTEMGARLRAKNSATLSSSVHLVCRPREHFDGSLRTSETGDWRQVLSDLPRRIHEWMPRLAEEGTVGADAIFACLGPALEIFSRFSRVERANGEPVSLREYLEQVWAAVSREALSMIFADPETSGLDEDARLTAMWLWTTAAPSASSLDEHSDDESDDDEERSRTVAGFGLEFDAARKIAQGLGARLEALDHVVEVKGDKARLLSAAERTKYLFGGSDSAPTTKRSKKKPQRALFEELEEVAEQQGWGEVGTPRAGSTTLDRVHQAMILFGSGRGEALKRFLVDEGVGRGAQFWKLAQALSALYPTGTDEKRWVDGVLARKKALGF